MTSSTRSLRDYLETAAEARKRGDLGAADAAETLALVTLRQILAAEPAKAVQP